MTCHAAAAFLCVCNVSRQADVKLYSVTSVSSKVFEERFPGFSLWRELNKGVVASKTLQEIGPAKPGGWNRGSGSSSSYERSTRQRQQHQQGGSRKQRRSTVGDDDDEDEDDWMGDDDTSEEEQCDEDQLCSDDASMDGDLCTAKALHMGEASDTSGSAHTVQEHGSTRRYGLRQRRQRRLQCE
jgi:hypothetical protein